MQEMSGTKTLKNRTHAKGRERQQKGEKVPRRLLLEADVICLKSVLKILMHPGQEQEPFWEVVRQYVTRELKMFLPFDPVILLPGFHPSKRTKMQIKMKIKRRQLH